MMIKIFTALIILVSTTVTAQNIDLGEIAKLSQQSAIWRNAGVDLERSAAVAFKTGSGPIWVRVGLNATSIAGIVGTSAAVYLAEKGLDYAQGKWFEWLGLHNLAINNNKIQTMSEGYEVIENTELANQFIAGNVLAYQNYKIFRTNRTEAGQYLDQLGLNGPYTYAWDTGDTAVWCRRNWENTKNGCSAYVGASHQNQVRYVRTAVGYTSSQQIIDFFKADLEALQPTAGNTSAKKIYESLENDIGNSINNNNTTDKTNTPDPGSGKSPKQKLTEEVKNSLSPEVKQQINNGNTITNNTVISNTSNIPEAREITADSIATKLKTMMFGDETDITYKNIDASENSTIINDPANTLKTSQEKQKTKEFLDGLKTKTTNFTNKIKELLNNMINAQAGVCKLEYTVFSQSHEINFCNINFDALKNVIMAVSCIVAVMILIL